MSLTYVGNPTPVNRIKGATLIKSPSVFDKLSEKKTAIKIIPNTSNNRYKLLKPGDDVIFHNDDDKGLLAQVTYLKLYPTLDTLVRNEELRPSSEIEKVMDTNTNDVVSTTVPNPSLEESIAKTVRLIEKTLNPEDKAAISQFGVLYVKIRPVL